MILIHKPRKDGLALIGANAIADKTVLSPFLTYGDSHKNYVTNSHRNYVTLRLRQGQINSIHIIGIQPISAAIKIERLRVSAGSHTSK